MKRAMKVKGKCVTAALRAACASTILCAAVPAFGAFPGPTGSSANAAVAQLVADAEKAIKAGKLPLAVIDLKNATDADPHNGQVRAKLGVVLMRTGNYYEAERELRQARRDGAPDQQVLPFLFSTMISRNEEKNLLDEFAEPSTSANSARDILNARALAFLQLGQFADATAEMDKSLKLRRDMPGLLLRARIAQKSGDVHSAFEFTDEAIAMAPDKLEAPLLKIDLLLVSNDPNGALALANQLVAKFPSDLRGQFARIEVLMRLKRDDQAKAAVDSILAKTPGISMGVYYRALLLSRAGNNKDAWRVAQVLPQEFVAAQPGVAITTSQIAERAGNLQTAAAILNTAIGRFPQSPELRTQLAAMRVRQKDLDGAVNVLKPFADKLDPASAQMLATLYVRDGKASLAQGVLEKLVQSGKGTDAALLQLVALDNQLGQADQALKVLSAAVVQKPTDTVLVNQLVIALSLRQRFAEALSVIDKLGDGPGQRLSSLLLRGQVLAAEHKFDDALASYAEAMQTDPANQLALYGHATVLESLQRYKDAEKDLHAVLALNPRNMAASLKLAELAARQNEAGEVRNILTTATKMSPQDPTPRLSLARYLASRNDMPGALEALNSVLKVSPNNTQGLAMLGTIQLSMGKKPEAVATLRRLVSLAPRDSGFQILLANALFANGDRAGAKAVLKNAVDQAKTSPQVRLAQINMLLAEKDVDGAITAAQAYQASNPGPQGDLLLGDTLARAGRRDQAMTLYKKTFEEHPESAVVLRIATNSIAAGDPKSAAKILASWVSKNPDDITARGEYAMLLMQQGDNDDAAQEFRELVRKNPNNAVSLNNLAWLMRDKDPMQAMSLASRAVNLAPNSSSVLDTLGWIELKHGKPADSLSLFKRAHSLRPQDGEISYHLVLSLEATGNHDAAKGLLKALLASHVEFADRAEANKLAQTWH